MANVQTVVISCDERSFSVNRTSPRQYTEFLQASPLVQRVGFYVPLCGMRVGTNATLDLISGAPESDLIRYPKQLQHSH
jgi:hypothetical protein